MRVPVPVDASGYAPKGPMAPSVQPQAPTYPQAVQKSQPSL